MPKSKQYHPHLLVIGSAKSESFSPKPGHGSPSIPEVDRQSHGSALLSQLETVKQEAEKQRQEDGLADEGGFRLQLVFEGTDIPLERLEQARYGIEILNVKTEEKQVTVTVSIPEGKLDYFENLIKAYLTEDTDKGKPKNQALIATIQQLRTGAFEELWTDDSETALPKFDDEAIWWEIWLPIRNNDRYATVEFFKTHAHHLEMTVSKFCLEFPERTVLTAYGTKAQLTRSTKLLNHIAEIRRLKETEEFFFQLHPKEQREWAQDLLDRVEWPDSSAPAVCILDTGVNNGHPMLKSVLTDEDRHTLEPAWSLDDMDGHGTAMAGLAVYGDLINALQTMQTVQINHHLESVKILRQSGDNIGDGEHHGAITVEAVNRPAVTNAQRQRIFCMALTAKDNRDRERPSAWSAAVDKLAAGAEDDTPRLMLISAGNVPPDVWSDYPHSNATDGIHDPGQAWNALTIGAYTEKSQLPADMEGKLLALVGGLCPASTTSQTWKTSKHKWPLKPDVVFEGGNAARTELGIDTPAELSLLTTHHQPFRKLFVHFDSTSAATALAARMAAQIQAAYPDFWPETVRALMVHSADWTPAMRQMFLDDCTQQDLFGYVAKPLHKYKKSDVENLIRHCGFGVPDLSRALWSANNALTLIAQDFLQPFEKDGSTGKSKDMNLHSLPWPLEALESLGATQVEMRITLSYFIEPNPSARGFSRRYSYASHALRFAVKRPDETVDRFRGRVNRNARDEEEGTKYGGDSDGWGVGDQKRHLGSLHADIWEGSAADLAHCGYLAVYPALGWWRENPSLQRYNKLARYALIISIRTPATDVDIYTPVATKLSVAIEI